MTEVSIKTNTASELLEITSALRRALQRRTGRAGGVPELSEAQRELIRLVRRNPGIRVGEAAAELRLAANTVSTLVTSLVASGWLDRTSDPTDARSTRLELTSIGAERVAEWRDRRAAAVDEALASLTPAERNALEGAISALQALVKQIEGRS